MEINKIKPNRLFTFGCSFTKYRLNTWANILAKKLEVKKFYNFGASAACNLFIGTRLSQAIKYYNIDKNDLEGGGSKPGNSLTNALNTASKTSAGYSDAQGRQLQKQWKERK